MLKLGMLATWTSLSLGKRSRVLNWRAYMAAFPHIMYGDHTCTRHVDKRVNRHRGPEDADSEISKLSQRLPRSVRRAVGCARTTCH